MQSEVFDKKIKEAADHHHPAYDENAWVKMEKLLDQHLPQKEDKRRRIFFFLLLFLLVGGGSTLFFLANNSHKNSSIISLPGQPTDSRVPVNGTDRPPVTVTNSEPVTGKNNESAGSQKEIIPAPSETSIGFNQPVVTGKSLLAGPSSKNKKPALLFSDDKPATVVQDYGKPLAEIPATPGNSNAIQPATASRNTEPAEKKSDPVLIATATPSKKEEATLAGQATQPPVKLKNKRSSTFSLNVSAGSDVTIARSGKTGTMKLFTGFGIGYTYKERITIRTGLYTGSKVYTASPDEYHPPAAFYFYYPNLQKIDANCRIYEIPVSLAYHFARTPKQNWFVSSGVSSFLMKKETYNYFYKQSPSAPTISRERSMRGINKHYFAGLTLSGGYQRNIGKAVSVTAEPYLKLPLSGIGYGKVMLKSSGVMFTLDVKPIELLKKKNKPGR